MSGHYSAKLLKLPVVTSGYDALLLLSFGGPEAAEDVEPFLRRVVGGRNVPAARLAEVAERYHRFGGRSPLNDTNRRLLADLRDGLATRGVDLPWYWGNRNWHPFLADTVARMRADRVRRALVFATSAFSSYSSCRQYLDNLEEARRLVGEGAPELVKLRPFFNHPAFLDALSATLAAARADAGPDAPVLFTAHSIPASMAERCDYQAQLLETARLVAEANEVPDGAWFLAFQSRSGPSSQPWLEPDVSQQLRALATRPGTEAVVVAPIGFVSDHMEVVYDLDIELAEQAHQAGVRLVRAGTVVTHPLFVELVADLVTEQLQPGAPVLARGRYPARPGRCPPGCCLAR